MKLIIDKNIFERFKGVKIGVIIVESLDNKGKNIKIEF